MQYVVSCSWFIFNATIYIVDYLISHRHHLSLLTFSCSFEYREIPGKEDVLILDEETVEMIPVPPGSYIA